MHLYSTLSLPDQPKTDPFIILLCLTPSDNSTRQGKALQANHFTSGSLSATIFRICSLSSSVISGVSLRDNSDGFFPELMFAKPATSLLLF